MAAVVNINDLEVYTFDRSKCGDEFVVSLNDDLFFVRGTAGALDRDAAQTQKIMTSCFSRFALAAGERARGPGNCVESL